MSSSSSQISPKSNSILEACYKLGITPPTLHELLNSGRIRSYKVGRSRYITDDAIRDFQAEAESLEFGARSVGGAPEPGAA